MKYLFISSSSNDAVVKSSLGTDKKIKYLKAQSVWKSVSVNLSIEGREKKVWPDVQFL